MIKTATISSKRQLTIPVSFFETLNLSSVRTMLIEQKNNTLVLTPIQSLINNLAGSVATPPEYKNKNIDDIIENSKAEYFSKKGK